MVYNILKTFRATAWLKNYSLAVGSCLSAESTESKQQISVSLYLQIPYIDKITFLKVLLPPDFPSISLSAVSL